MKKQKMSIHAQLTPEAQRAIENQKRNTTITSIVIAILSLALLSLVLAFCWIYLPSPYVASPGFTYVKHETPEVIVIPEHVATFTKPSPPSSTAGSRLLLAETRSSLSFPQTDSLENENTHIGNGDMGDGNWNGNGDGSPAGEFTPITGGLKKRCSKQERESLIAEAGGDVKIDEHVVRALRFLKGSQAADGGWGTQHRSAMTALALLSYLGHCETPESEEFGDSCLRAITFLIDQGLKNNGRLSSSQNEHHAPYEEAIATYALAEAYSFCRNMSIPHLQETVQKAGQFLIDNQHKSGGWDYGYAGDNQRGGDLSITGWHMQALHACTHTEIDFKNIRTCLNKGVRYIESLQDSSGGFGYTNTAAAGSAPWHTLTGTGMLCLQMNGKSEGRHVSKGARYALKSAPFSYASADCDLYAHYYLALAMFQCGGEEWKSYQSRLLPQLMEKQSPDGSWPLPGAGQKVLSPGALFAENSSTAMHYRTCLAALTMEVYYRYLKITK